MESRGRSEVHTHDEGLHTARPRTSRLCHDHLFEKDLELRIQHVHVPPSEDLGHKLAARLQHAQRQVQRREKQLALHVDVQVMQAGHVGRAVAQHQVHRVRGLALGRALRVAARVQRREEQRHRRGVRDVRLQRDDARQGRDGLQVNRHDLDVVPGPGGRVLRGNGGLDGRRAAGRRGCREHGEHGAPEVRFAVLP